MAQNGDFFSTKNRVTRKDLAFYYEVSYQTVRTWIKNDKVLDAELPKNLNNLTPNMVELFIERIGLPKRLMSYEKQKDV